VYSSWVEYNGLKLKQLAQTFSGSVTEKNPWVIWVAWLWNSLLLELTQNFLTLKSYLLIMPCGSFQIRNTDSAFINPDTQPLYQRIGSIMLKYWRKICYWRIQRLVKRTLPKGMDTFSTLFQLQKTNDCEDQPSHPHKFFSPPLFLIFLLV
jgi:hypothetical protein